MILLDTHVFVWFLKGDQRLGVSSRKSIERMLQETAVAIAAITPWEIAMLEAKGRISVGQALEDWLEKHLSQPGMRLLPLEPSIAVDSVRLPGSFHADPADQMIVATARHYDIALITADRAILSYGASGFARTHDARI